MVAANELWEPANLPEVSGAVAPRFSIVRGGLYAAGGVIFAAGSLSTGSVREAD